MKNITYSLLASTLAFTGLTTQADNLGTRSATQWEYEQWSLNNASYSGNPFDVMATVTFTHSETGEKRTTGMFYDGGNTWRFRFTGTQPGKWTFTTNSSDGDLDGHTGTVNVSEQTNAEINGFLSHDGNRYVIDTIDGKKGYLFNVWMNDKKFEHHFWEWPSKISDVRNLTLDYLDDAREHGMENVFIMLSNSVFKFGVAKHTDHNSVDPDLTTFDALDEIITTLHANGGRLHIWRSGDEARKQTVKGVEGGIGGDADLRMQRYIAARLGPLPGWSMSYGYDLHEYIKGWQLDNWAENLHNQFGWQHLLGARSYELPNAGNNMQGYSTNDVEMDSDYSTEAFPRYNEMVGDLNRLKDRPHLYEERFVLGRWGRDDDDHLTMLWEGAMAGGMGNWFGYWEDTNPSYSNKNALQTFYKFWHEKQRFPADFERANSLSNGYVLANDARSLFVVYRADTDNISIDLSAAGGTRKAVAVDANGAYSEIDLGTLNKGDQNISLPYTSDWAIAIGDFGEAGDDAPANQPPVADAGNNQTVTDSDDNGSESVSLDASDSYDPEGYALADYEWEWSGGSASGETTSVNLAAGKTHNITLTVTDNAGATDQDTVSITVEAAPADDGSDGDDGGGNNNGGDSDTGEYADSFEDGDISDWTAEQDGAWTVTDGKVEYPSNQGNPAKILTYNNGNNWSNYSLAVDMASPDDDPMGVVFYYQDADNYLGYFMTQQADGGPRQILFKVENGARTILDSVDQGYKANQTYTVEVSVDTGGDMVVTNGDVTLSASTPDGFTGGTAGLYVEWNQGVTFDNFVSVVGDTGDSDDGGNEDGGSDGGNGDNTGPGSATVEAESASDGELFAPFTVQSDGGRDYIVWPGDGGHNRDPGDDVDGQAHYTVQVDSAGSVTLYATVAFPNGGDDSFWYKLEGVDSGWSRQNGRSNSGWTERDINTWSNVPAGTYTLKIQRREDGSKIDSFRLEGALFGGSASDGGDSGGDGDNGPTLVTSLEAETASSQSDFSPLRVDSGNGRDYIVWSEKGDKMRNPGDDVAGQAHYPIVVDSAGQVTVYGTIDFESQANSYWYKLDGHDSDWQRHDNLFTDGFEEKVFGRWSNVPAGDYTLKVLRREGGAKVDTLRIEGAAFKTN